MPEFVPIDDDLLSLAVVGKPGEGKILRLVVYVAMLLGCGAEVHCFDPHGNLEKLAVLQRCVRPDMPETGRIYYYNQKEEIIEAVSKLSREMDERSQSYRFHLERVHLEIKYPIVILSDELPILSVFDEQVRQEYKELNQGRDKDEPKLEAPSLVYLIRRVVLEARKLKMFFIVSSGQSLDMSVWLRRLF